MTAVVNARDEPFLAGGYAPTGNERDDADLVVIGRLPDGLAGMYLRNGPNPMFEPKGRYHVFDGDGMLHALSLDGHGHASYRNRWIRTEGLAVEQRAGRAIYGGMADGNFPTREEIGDGPPVRSPRIRRLIRSPVRCSPSRTRGSHRF